ncbi:unnamed protein product [Notodromas monacha]|uniref:Ig-like domain-containing protein n=1 Tax=Notodromas monacha TaxID=399045 RepID=A0A7R9BQL1_9CRUS|nr:unnamed protein product [Notodromas monacha]CAG0919639.1 unnamed protein product [Notodromas monacha]
MGFLPSDGLSDKLDTWLETNAAGVSGQVVLQNYASPSVAKPGENVTFYCVVDQDILKSYCMWQKPGGGLVIPGAYTGDEYDLIEYTPDSVDAKRRCDFTLKSVKPEHHGKWQCQPNFERGPIQEVGLRPFNFVVAAVPEPRRPVILHNGVDSPDASVDAEEADILKSYCMWQKPGGGLVIPGAYTGDEYDLIEYTPDSVDAKRRCDFTLKSVKPEHHGKWQCQPNFERGPIQEVGLRPFNFVVAAVPEPRRPVILHNGVDSPDASVDAEEAVTLSCNLFKTRPKPQFHWYWVSPNGGSMTPMTDISPVEGEVAEPGTDDLSSYNSTITLKMRADENGMKIRCVANHTMLDEAHNATDLALNIQGQATLKQCVPIGSGMMQSVVDGYYCDQRAYYLAGKDATIEVVFAANPEPRRLEWVTSKNAKNPLASGEERDGFKAMHWQQYHLKSEDPALLDQFDRKDLYSAKLQVTDLGEADAGRYELRIFNGVVDQRSGEESARFRFDVQIGEKPPAGTASVVIIVVALVLVVVFVALGVTFYAWRNSRLCFKGEKGSSGKSKREVTAAATPPSASQGGGHQGNDGDAHRLDIEDEDVVGADGVGGKQAVGGLQQPEFVSDGHGNGGGREGGVMDKIGQKTKKGAKKLDVEAAEPKAAENPAAVADEDEKEKTAPVDAKTDVKPVDGGKKEEHQNGNGAAAKNGNAAVPGKNTAV